MSEIFLTSVLPDNIKLLSNAPLKGKYISGEIRVEFTSSGDMSPFLNNNGDIDEYKLCAHILHSIESPIKLKL